MIFQNRTEAAHQLADLLTGSVTGDLLVLGLPRGGVVTARVISDRLSWPFSVLVSRKIGAPSNPELAIGAICENGQMVIDNRAVSYLGLSPSQVHGLAVREAGELDRRITVFRSGRSLPPLPGCRVVLVDDGIATGLTIQAAVKTLKMFSLSGLIVAAPVSSPSALVDISPLVDEVLVLEAPLDFSAVGQFYREFPQVTDDQVRELLD